MSDLTGGHLVARTLKEAGVRHVFTLCGGHILPIYDGCLNEGIQVVDMRHEQACAHAGDAYARLARSIGVGGTWRAKFGMTCKGPVQPRSPQRLAISGALGTRQST